jgi:Caspase domain
MKLKRALLIGIDRYQAFQDLSGCVNDVAAIEPLLQLHDTPDEQTNFDCRKVVSHTDNPPTTDVVLTGIAELLSPGVDVALLYFAGHAASVDDELHLVTYDGTATTPGVPVSRVFDLIFESKISEVVLILDCCFAGQAGQVTLGVREGTLLPDGLSMLTSSRANQTSTETNGRGFFSTLFCEALSGAARDGTGWVTLANAFDYVQKRCGAWGQQPMLKANMLVPCALRRVKRDSRSNLLRYRWWALASIALLGLVAYFSFRKSPPFSTEEVLIDCKSGECNQKATMRCPEGLFGTRPCELRTVQGVCALGNIRSDNRMVQADIRAKAGSRCAVTCTCDDKPRRGGQGGKREPQP